MKIEIKYYASLREATNLNSESLETNSKTALQLFEELDKKYNFQIETSNLKVAINEEYSEFSDNLKDGDIVVFIPPVAGG